MDSLRLEFERASCADWGAIASTSASFAQYFGRAAALTALGADGAAPINEAPDDVAVSPQRTSQPEPVPVSCLVLGAAKAGKTAVLRHMCPAAAAAAEDGHATNSALDFWLHTRAWDPDMVRAAPCFSMNDACACTISCCRLISTFSRASNCKCGAPVRRPSTRRL